MNKWAVFSMLTALTVVALVGCVTINVYFPAAAIKDLSRQIEEEVRKEAAKADESTTPQAAPQAPAETPKGQGSQSFFDMMLGVTPAYAQQADAVGAPEVTSPAIRKIIESRAARVDSLNGYKASGAIGESNEGLLEIRNLEAVSDLKGRAELQRLVKAENADREQLFQEMAIAKKVDLSQLPKIRETYAATLREMARPGDWIQMPDGTWKQK